MLKLNYFITKFIINKMITCAYAENNCVILLHLAVECQRWSWPIGVRREDHVWCLCLLDVCTPCNINLSLVHCEMIAQNTQISSSAFIPSLDMTSFLTSLCQLAIKNVSYVANNWDQVKLLSKSCLCDQCNSPTKLSLSGLYDRIWNVELLMLRHFRYCRS